MKISGLFERIKKGAYAYGNLYLRRQTPVLVYAPGRVGSISMICALREAGVFSFKIEWFEKEKYKSVHFCKRHIIDAHKKAYIITLVRDPIEILSSLFFSKASRGHLPLGQVALEEKSIEKLLVAFEKEVLNGPLFSEYIYWYEQEFIRYLNLNIFNYPFDTRNKFDTIEHDTYPTLILRTDLPDKTKEDQVSSFLKVSNFRLNLLNVKEVSQNGKIYTEFKSQLKLSSILLNTIYDTPYAQHFFSAEEIAERKESLTK